jgi:hypothetical protein
MAPIQRGVRIFNKEGRPIFVLLANPYQILSKHINLAHIDHRDQKIEDNIEELSLILELTRKSKYFKYFFNAIGAGASIPNHLHIQGFNDALPIEKVQEEQQPLYESANLRVTQLRRKDWPVTTFVMQGEDKEIVNLLIKIIAKIKETFPEKDENGNPNPRRAFNILFTRDAQGSPKIYFTPRKNSKPSYEGAIFTNEYGACEIRRQAILMENIPLMVLKKL